MNSLCPYPTGKMSASTQLLNESLSSVPHRADKDENEFKSVRLQSGPFKVRQTKTLAGGRRSLGDGSVPAHPEAPWQPRSQRCHERQHRGLVGMVLGALASGCHRGRGNGRARLWEGVMPQAPSEVPWCCVAWFFSGALAQPVPALENCALRSLPGPLSCSQRADYCVRDITMMVLLLSSLLGLLSPLRRGFSPNPRYRLCFQTNISEVLLCPSESQ